MNRLEVRNQVARTFRHKLSGADPVSWLDLIPWRFLYILTNAYNSSRDFLVHRTEALPTDVDLRQIAIRARTRTDTSDHLPTLFVEAMSVRPNLIVELGVRGGESTFVFERVATRTGAHLVSVDIEDCSDVSTYPRWQFVKADDTQFAKDFPSWCEQHSIRPDIDVLFIDTSHLFEHTLQEIALWFPYVGNGGKVIFHDTNQKRIYSRKDGSLGAVGPIAE